jgi:hypothetical protein
MISLSYDIVLMLVMQRQGDNLIHHLGSNPANGIGKEFALPTRLLARPEEFDPRRKTYHREEILKDSGMDFPYRPRLTALHDVLH